MKLRFIISMIVGSLSLMADELRIYSERHYGADKTIFADFTEKTGIEIKVIKAGANELLTRLDAEKAAPQADLYITKDAAGLERAHQKGLLAPLDSESITAQVPAGLRGKDGTWTAITMRGRVVVYAKDRVNPADLPKTYSDLAKPDYKGKILIRSSSSAYNRSLLSSIYYNEGKAAALKWAQGIKNNMARPPQGGDRDQVRAVAQGIGDYAVTNTYYLGVMEQSEKESDRAARAAVNILFPTSGENGTHVNVSGAGIVKGAANADNARQLIEFIVSSDVQRKYQDLTSEYAVAQDVEPNEIISNWGEITPDTTSLHHFLDNYDDAVKLFDFAGWQ